MVARWLMAVKDNLLVIRMDVAGLTQWVQVGGGKGFAGGVGFERIVEICGKNQRASRNARAIKLNLERGTWTTRGTTRDCFKALRQGWPPKDLPEISPHPC